MSEKALTLADLQKRLSQHNLNMHIRYYNEHKRLVSNEIAHMDEKLESGAVDPKHRRDLEISKHIYSNSYHTYMVLNCFLTMYSHFEECLGVTCDLFSDEMPEKGSSGLDRFKKHFKDKHNVNLSDGPHWSFLRDCAKVRNILLHAGGNVTLLCNSNEAHDLLKRNKGCLDTENARLFPQEELLVRFSRAIADFTDWLIDQTK